MLNAIGIDWYTAVVNTEIIVLGIGVLLALGYVSQVIFNRFRIPDVLILVIAGIIVGPVSGLIPADTPGLIQFGSILATVTLVVILFEAGLHIRIRQLQGSLGTAWWLMIATMVTTTAVITPITVLLFQSIGWIEGIILGVALGGVSAGIGIPIIQGLPVTSRAKQIISLETNMNDVVTIVLLVIALALLGTSGSAGNVIPSTIQGIVISAAIGASVGLLWSQLVDQARMIQYGMFATPIMALLVFGLAEIMGEAGVLSVFVFGIILGNAGTIALPIRKLLPSWENTAFNTQERTLFNGIIFLLKTVFFFYIGLQISLEQPLVIGFALGVMVLLVGLRTWIVNWITKDSLPEYDKEILSKLLPKGLLGAAIITLVQNQDVTDIMYAVTFASVLLTGILIAQTKQLKKDASQHD